MKRVAIWLLLVVVVLAIAVAGTRWWDTHHKTASATTTTSTVVTTTSTAALHECDGTTLSASYAFGQGAMGTLSSVLTISSTDPCLLFGTPRVGFTDINGTPLALTVTAPPANVVPMKDHVKVSSGHDARVTLVYSDVPTGNATSCPQVGTMTLSYSAQSLVVTPRTLEPCGSRIAVSNYY